LIIQLSEDAEPKSKHIKGIIYKREKFENDKVFFEKGNNTTINYRDILCNLTCLERIELSNATYYEIIGNFLQFFPLNYSSS